MVTKTGGGLTAKLDVKDLCGVFVGASLKLLMFKLKVDLIK